MRPDQSEFIIKLCYRISLACVLGVFGVSFFSFYGYFIPTEKIFPLFLIVGSLAQVPLLILEKGYYFEHFRRHMWLPLFFLILYFLYVGAQYYFGLAPQKEFFEIGSISPYKTRVHMMSLLYYVSFFFILIKIINDRRYFKWILYFLLGLGFFNLFMTLTEVLSGSEKFFWFYDSPSIAQQAGTFINANHFGAYLVFTVSIFLAWVNYRLQDRGRWLAEARKRNLKNPELYAMNQSGVIFISVYVLLAVVVCLICHARAPAIALAVLVLIYLLLANIRSRNKGAIFFTLVLLLGTAALLADFGFDRLFDVFSAETMASSLQQRFQMMDNAWPYILDKIWVGYGLGTSGSLAYAFSLRDFVTALVPNQIYHLLLEVGVIGASLFSLLFISIIFISLFQKSKITSRLASAMRWQAYVSIVVVLVLSLVDLHLTVRPVGFLFVFQLAVIAGFGYYKSEHESRLRVGLARLFWVLLILFCVVPVSAYAWKDYKIFVLTHSDMTSSNDLRKAIAYRQDNGKLWHLLSMEYQQEAAWTENSREYQTAVLESIAASEEAIALDPKNAKYWFHLGWREYWYAGRIDAAILHLKRAHELMPASEVIPIHLLKIYLNETERKTSASNQYINKLKAKKQYKRIKNQEPKIPNWRIRKVLGDRHYKTLKELEKEWM